MSRGGRKPVPPFAGESLPPGIDPGVAVQSTAGEGATHRKLPTHAAPVPRVGLEAHRHAASPSPSALPRLDHRVKRPVAGLSHSVGEVT
jgi:hypothetical protein